MVKISNQARLSRKMKALRTLTADAMRLPMAEAAEVIVATQKRLAPVDDGDLRRSIKWEYGGAGVRRGGAGASNNETRVTISAGNNGVYWARLVEYGTTSMAAQPYFFPGYRAEKKRAKAIIQKGVRAAVRARAT